MSLIVLILLIWIAATVIGICLWIDGFKNKSIVITVIGAFLALNIIGLVIAVLQCNVWNKTVITINNNR